VTVTLSDIIIAAGFPSFLLPLLFHLFTSTQSVWMLCPAAKHVFVFVACVTVS